MSYEQKFNNIVTTLNNMYSTVYMNEDRTFHINFSMIRNTGYHDDDKPRTEFLKAFLCTMKRGQFRINEEFDDYETYIKLGFDEELLDKILKELIRGL